MNLSKRQKMLSAVFLIGVVGLVADRTILRPQGGPQAASAGSLSAAPGAAAAANPASAPAPAPARAPLAERLNNLLSGQKTEPNELRDPFCLPATWSDAVSVEGPRPADTVRRFLQKHQLNAVGEVQGKAQAQVDDRLLRPGQELDGFTLISVDYHSAVFERDGKQAVLDLIVK